MHVAETGGSRTTAKAGSSTAPATPPQRAAGAADAKSSPFIGPPSTPSRATTTASKAGTRFLTAVRDERPGPTLAAAAKLRAATEAPAPASSTTTSRMNKLEREEQRAAAREAKAAARSGGATATDVDAAASARRGAATSNDGKSDFALRGGKHDGARDRRIAELQRSAERNEREAAKVDAEIGKISERISDKRAKADRIGDVGKVLAPGVGVIAGLLGKKDPVQAVAEKLMGLEGDRVELEQRKGDLARERDQIASDLRELEDERDLNFLASVAHSTGMPSAIAAVLEGSGGLKIAVDRTGTGSDASYDLHDRTIRVERESLAKASQSRRSLERQGIVDRDGNIRDAKRFDASSDGNAAITTTTLVGVHEVIHGAQDTKQQLEAALRAGQSKVNAANVLARRTGATTEERQSMVAGARHDAELSRIDAVEYDAYVGQETIELQAGKVKQGFVTVRPDGSLLPRAQAVANIAALQSGSALPHGPSAGRSFGAGAPAAHDHDHDDHEVDGKRAPGKRAPGDEVPGKRAPGDEVPGKRAPGFEVGGKRAPGDEVPGKRAPGFEVGGKRAPGDEVPGKRAPGFVT